MGGQVRLGTQLLLTVEEAMLVHDASPECFKGIKAAWSDMEIDYRSLPQATRDKIDRSLREPISTTRHQYNRLRQLLPRAGL
jgi:hypothetical protein